MMMIIPPVSNETFEKVLSIIPVEPRFVDVHLYAKLNESEDILKVKKNLPGLEFTDFHAGASRIKNPTKDLLIKLYKQDKEDYKTPRADFKEATFYFEDIVFILTPYQLEIKFNNNDDTNAIALLCKELFKTKIEIVINKSIDFEYPQQLGTVTTNFSNGNSGLGGKALK